MRRGSNVRTHEPHEVLTTTELAEWLRLSVSTIRRMGFPSIAPGRYLFAHVLQRCEEIRLGRGLGGPVRGRGS